jgi:hypothetical protein
MQDSLCVLLLCSKEQHFFDRSLNMEQEAREREKEKERTQSLTGLPAATTGPSGDNSNLILYWKA